MKGLERQISPAPPGGGGGSSSAAFYPFRGKGKISNRHKARRIPGIYTVPHVINVTKSLTKLVGPQRIF